jgi:hypothetical protein
MNRSEIRQEIFCQRSILSQNAVRLCDLEATPKQGEFCIRCSSKNLNTGSDYEKCGCFSGHRFSCERPLKAMSSMSYASH